MVCKYDFYIMYPNFNWKYYIEKQQHYNLENDEFQALEHFLNIGVHQKSLYNPYCFYNGFEKDNIDVDEILKTFDWNFYLNYYEDLHEKYNTKYEALNHYLKHGKSEKRLINDNELQIFNIIKEQTNFFIYYSKLRWDLLFQRPHQIMRHFNKKYLKIFITSNFTIKYEKKYNLLIIPYELKDYIFERYNNLIIYITDTRLYDELMVLKNNNKINKIVYDLIDAPIDEFIIWKDNLSKMVNNADYVLYSHPKLIEYLNEINKNKRYYYISNSCDYEHFKNTNERIHPKPKDFPESNKPILGYYGAFAEWLDYDIIKKYADEGKYHILMIGGHPDAYNIRFTHNNITWLNHKDYSELPVYLSWFDLCFLPFKNCHLIKYVNPCKIWEYMCSQKDIIKYNLNLEINKLETYEENCEKINDILETKIDIISLFFNNAEIIKDYEKNIINLQNRNVEFILVYNNSIDNTLEELEKLKKYENVKIIKTNNNGCSLGKNCGIMNSRNNCNYLFFLDSDFVINEDCLKNLLNNMTNEIKYVSFYGGNLDNYKYIGGSNLNDNEIINNISEKKYLGGGCSLICNELINNYNLCFDVVYDPFIMQDVDFSFKVLKYTKLKKIAMNSEIKHLGSYTINKFRKDFYKEQLLRNSIIFMNKHNLFKFGVLDDLDKFINIEIYNKMLKYYEKYEIEKIKQNTKLLITKKNYYYFKNINFYYNYLDNIFDFINLNCVDSLIIDFDYYIDNYEILNVLNLNIEIILDLKDINYLNYNKFKNVSAIYTFSNIYELLLKNVFNNIKIKNLKYGLFQSIEKEKKFIMVFNEKYNKLFDFFKDNNLDYKCMNKNEIINCVDDCNIYIDLTNDYELIKILIDKKCWILTCNIYPICELINEDINGNMIEADYIENKNNLINSEINLNIDNYISLIKKKYL